MQLEKSRENKYSERGKVCMASAGKHVTGWKRGTSRVKQNWFGNLLDIDFDLTGLQRFAQGLST